MGIRIIRRQRTHIFNNRVFSSLDHHYCHQPRHDNIQPNLCFDVRANELRWGFAVGVEVNGCPIQRSASRVLVLAVWIFDCWLDLEGDASAWVKATKELRKKMIIGFIPGSDPVADNQSHSIAQQHRMPPPAPHHSHYPTTAHMHHPTAPKLACLPTTTLANSLFH